MDFVLEELHGFNIYSSLIAIRSRGNQISEAVKVEVKVKSHGQGIKNIEKSCQND